MTEPEVELPVGDPRTRWVSIGVTVVLLAIIFGWLLPLFIDFREVLAAIRGLSVGEVAVLTVLGLLWTTAEATVTTVLVPDLRWWPGYRAWAASNTASVGPSPLDLAVRYGMYAEVGVTPAASATGIFLSGIFGFGIRLLIPTLALGVLAVSGRAGETGTTVAVVAVVGFVVTAGVLGASVASARFARWVGSAGQWLHNRVLARWRDPVDDWAARAETIRRRMRTTLADRWHLALGAATAGQALAVTIFILSYRFIGLVPDSVSAFQAFVAYAAGLIANFIPGVPGGIGASELIHVVLLTEFTGLDIGDEVAAAGFTHRIFTWVMPVLLGGVFLVGWLRRRSAAAARRHRP